MEGDGDGVGCTTKLNNIAAALDDTTSMAETVRLAMIKTVPSIGHEDGMLEGSVVHFDPVSKALHIDLILEKIIFHVLFDKNGKLDRSQLRHLRLVHPHWTSTVSYLLSDPHFPSWSLNQRVENCGLFQLGVNQPNAGFLDDFIVCMTENPHRLNPSRMAPFKLLLTAESFTAENRQRLQDIFLRCGQGLVHLMMFCPVRMSGDLNWPNMTPHLPNLIQFDIVYKDRDHDFIQTIGNRDHRSWETDCQQLAAFTRNILLGARENLKGLNIGSALDGGRTLIMDGSFFLPKSLRRLSLNFSSIGITGDAFVQLMENNLLPHLTELSIDVSVSILPGRTASFEGGILRRVLNPVASTLEKLSLLGPRSWWKWDKMGREERFLFAFPRFMENLTTLEIDNCWHLENIKRSSPALNAVLPQLKKLRFNHRWEELNELINQSSGGFPDITCLQLFISNWEFEVDYMWDYMQPMAFSLSERKMRIVHSSFPNVVELEVHLSDGRLDGIRYIFKEITSLKKLKISAQYMTWSRQVEETPVAWDALFIGISPERAVTLWNAVFWEAGNGNLLQNFLREEADTLPFPGIQNLKCLDTLVLAMPYEEETGWREWKCDMGTDSESEEEADDDDDPSFRYLSDLSFDLAFFHMQKLKTIIVGMKYHKISQRTKEKWSSLKGTNLGIIMNDPEGTRVPASEIPVRLEENQRELRRMMSFDFGM